MAEDEAVSRAELSFHALVDSIQDYALFMLDLEGRVITWNSGAQRLYGYSPAEIAGQHFSLFYTPEDKERNHPDYELAVVRREGRYEETGWRVRRHGTAFWANVVVTPVCSSGSDIIGYAKVTRDLSAMREAEERLRRSEERLRLLIESVRDYAIFMLDPDGYITSWNPGAERLKGYKSEEVIGQHFSLFYTQEDRGRHHPEEELAIVRREGRYEEEGWRVRKDGTRFWANVVISIIQGASGELRGFAKVTRDLTEKRRAEVQEKEAAERLLRETRRTQEAHFALQLRDEFLSIAAHELRTPIATLKLKLQGVQRMLRNQDALGAALKALPDRVRSADQQASRLAALVERLLDLSRIANGRLELTLEPTDLVEVCRQAAEEFAETAEAQGTKIHLHAPPTLQGVWDRGRLVQVLSNLLSNAIKYGGGSPVEIDLAGSENTVSVTVRDHGEGIPAEHLGRVFDRFERAAAALGNQVGLGLGLYITRHIVEGHGGNIVVTSEREEGTAFQAILPRISRIAPIDPAISQLE